VSATVAAWCGLGVTDNQGQESGMKRYTIVLSPHSDREPTTDRFPLKELAEQTAYGLDDNEHIDAIAALQVGQTYVVSPYDGIAVMRVE